MLVIHDKKSAEIYTRKGQTDGISSTKSRKHKKA